jgi:hypothetical protein
VLAVVLLQIALAPQGNAVRSFVHNIPKITGGIEHSAIAKPLNHNHLVDTLHKPGGAIAPAAGKAASGLVGIATSAFRSIPARLLGALHGPCSSSKISRTTARR